MIGIVAFGLGLMLSLISPASLILLVSLSGEKIRKYSTPVVISFAAGSIFYLIGLGASATSDIWYVISGIDNQTVGLIDFRFVRFLVSFYLGDGWGLHYVFVCHFIGIYTLLKLYIGVGEQLKVSNRIRFFVLLPFLYPISFSASFEFITASALMNLALLLFSRKKMLRASILILTGLMLHIASAVFLCTYLLTGVLIGKLTHKVIAFIIFSSLFLFIFHDQVLNQYFEYKIGIYTHGVWSNYIGTTEYISLLLVCLRIMILTYLFLDSIKLYKRSNLANEMIYYNIGLIFLFILFLPFRTLQIRFSDFSSVFLAIYVLNVFQLYKFRVWNLRTAAIIILIFSYIFRPSNAMFLHGMRSFSTSKFVILGGFIYPLSGNIELTEHKKSITRWIMD